jgi:ribosomal RNA-processing protein 9
MEAKRKLEKKKLVQGALAKKKKASLLAAGGSSIQDVVDQGAIVKSLGDHINTRMQEIDHDDDLDETEFEERGRLLKAEVAERLGNAHRDLSQVATQLISGRVQPFFIGHNRNSITCCTQIDDLIWYGDKTGAVYSYSLNTHEKRFLTPSVGGGVLSIAVSDTRGARQSQNTLERSTVDHSCPSYVVVGAGDGNIHIWKTFDLHYMGALKLHRTGVTGVAFRAGTSTLYSCSMDSTVRVWAVAEMIAVDRLFGHLGPALAISALRKERAVTGGLDRSVRYWKMEAGSQVEYATMAAPTECVSLLNEDTLVAGSANGLLAVYDVGKLNPLCSVPAAHGSGNCGDGTGLEKEALFTMRKEPREGALQNGNGIMSMAAPANGNIIATGSFDGLVRIWHFVPRSANSGQEPQPARLNLVGTIPLEGVITGLSFSADAKRLIVVTAKEPRLGRWITRSECLNGIYVFPISGLKNAPSATTLAQSAKMFAPRREQSVRPLVVPPRKSEDEEAEAEGDAEDEEELDVDDDLPGEEDLFEVGEHGQLIFKTATKAAVVPGAIGKEGVMKKKKSSQKAGESKPKKRTAVMGKMKDRSRKGAAVVSKKKRATK